MAAGLGDQSQRGITLVASGRLQELYLIAFDTLSVAVQSIDSDDAVRRGLSIAARTIWTL
jgi:2-dehydro-3-deoxygalactonokinase